MLESFQFQTFSPLVGQPFRVQVGSDEFLDLELIEATDLRVDGPPVAPGARTPFSVLWRGPSTPILPQQIYRLEHEELGVFDLFLVPIGPDAHGMRYEAVFG